MMTPEHDLNAQNEHSGIELGHAPRPPHSRRRLVAAAGVAACLAAATAVLAVASVQQRTRERLGPDVLDYDQGAARELGAPPLVASAIPRAATARSVDVRAPTLAGSALSSSFAKPEASATPRARPAATRSWQAQPFPSSSSPSTTPSRTVDDRHQHGDTLLPGGLGDTGFAPSVGNGTTSGSTSNPALPNNGSVNPGLPNNSSVSGSSPNPALPNNSGSSSDSSSTPGLP
ncbi:MAG TPA: hypothetical protein VK745_25715 [Polyangiaceae bacterium]|nr:hypothetical protein [Polyangiaceae bacterium]